MGTICYKNLPVGATTIGSAAGKDAVEGTAV